MAKDAETDSMLEKAEDIFAASSWLKADGAVFANTFREKKEKVLEQKRAYCHSRGSARLKNNEYMRAKLWKHMGKKCELHQKSPLRF